VCFGGTGSNHPWGQLAGWLVQTCIQLHLEILEECRGEEAADETQTTKSRVRLYLFQLEKIEFALNG
jgi:hypothetical protein